MRKNLWSPTKWGPVVKISAARSCALEFSWFALSSHYVVKIFPWQIIELGTAVICCCFLCIVEIPWEIFRDVDIWPLEQLGLAQHIFAVLHVRFNDEMTRPLLSEWRMLKNWNGRCFTLKLSKVTRIGRQPLISGPVVNRANWRKSRKRWKAKQSTFFKGSWRVIPRLYLKRSCTWNIGLRLNEI